MKMKIAAGFGAVGLLTVAMPASAQQPPARPGPPPGGMIRPPMPPETRAQVEARARTMFAEADADRDGYITHVEADRAAAAMHARMAERMQQARAGAFDLMDRDKDGVISRTEFDASRNCGPMMGRSWDMPPPPPPPGPGMAPPPPPPGGGVPPAPPPPPGMAHGPATGAMFAMMDHDKDGRISRAEAVSAALARFDTLDADRDGALSPDERRAAPAMMMHRAPPKAGDR